jgi:hypothetical protein
MILGCDANATTQDIRLVCKSSDTTAAGCEHINQGGAAGTIVRLPENVSDCFLLIVRRTQDNTSVRERFFRARHQLLDVGESDHPRGGRKQDRDRDEAHASLSPCAQSRRRL